MKAPTVSEQPTCRLNHWIFAEALGCYFLVGHHLNFSSARCSTPLAWMDADNLICRTSSGRLYELELPWATGEDAKSLLRFFREHRPVSAVDSTSDLLSDPDLLYKNFVFPDPGTALLTPAEPRLKKMVEEPSVWLDKLVEKLTASDVDPARLKSALGLNELQWQSFRKKTLSSVPMATAFRGLLVEEIFSMSDQICGTTLGSNPPENTSPGIPFGVLDATETHELINQYCYWIHRVADYGAQKVIDGAASSDTRVH